MASGRGGDKSSFPDLAKAILDEGVSSKPREAASEDDAGTMLGLGNANREKAEAGKHAWKDAEKTEA